MDLVEESLCNKEDECNTSITRYCFADMKAYLGQDSADGRRKIYVSILCLRASLPDH